MNEPPEMIPCPHCGQFHPLGTEYCPENGLPIYLETETPPASQPDFWARLDALLHNRWFIFAGVGMFLVLGLASLATLLYLLLGPQAAPQGPDFSILTAEAGQYGQTQTALATLTVSPTPNAGETPQPTASQTAQLSAAPWQACSEAPYLSRVQAGATVEISSDPPLPNRVRSSAGTEGDILGYLQPGEQAQVLEGPACVNQWVWWRVRSLSGDLEGWTAEGDADGYWLVPVAP